jgi:hypothetical protein
MDMYKFFLGTFTGFQPTKKVPSSSCTDKITDYFNNLMASKNGWSNLTNAAQFWDLLAQINHMVVDLNLVIE